MIDFTPDYSLSDFPMDSISSFDELGDIPQLHASEETLDFVRFFARTYKAAV